MVEVGKERETFGENQDLIWIVNVLGILYNLGNNILNNLLPMSQSTNLRSTENTNEEPSKNGRFITAAYNIIGIVVSIFEIFSENKNGTIVLLLYPLLGIAIVLLGKGLIKFISYDKSRLFGSINIGFLFASLLLIFKSTDDYTIFQTTHIWLPFISISVIIVSLLYMTGANPFQSKGRIDAVLVLIIGLGYSYGSTRQINCAFDYSTPKIYNAVIIDHREYHGRRSDSYYLTLTAWGPIQRVKEEEVDGWLYDHVKPGDTVKVNFRQGLLKIPWFVVTKN